MLRNALQIACRGAAGLALVAGFVFGPAPSARAQDPHFSQYYANSLYLNPALAGSAVGARVGLNFRDQWPGLPGAYITYAASYDQHFDALSGGVGVHLLSDRVGNGVFLTNIASVIYANNLKINRKWALKTGFQASYAQRSLNWRNLLFPDQIDPRSGFVIPTREPIPASGVTKRNYADFSTGAMAYSEKYFGGFALHHLTTPNESLLGVGNGESDLPLRYTIHGGANFTVKKKGFRTPATVVSPNILFMGQAGFTELNIGAYLNRGPFVGGLWFRNTSSNSDALILLAGIQAGVFRFGYSYDLTVSRLRSATNGAHEISTILQFELSRKNSKKINKVKCPQF